jgi:galactonate dehydratase
MLINSLTRRQILLGSTLPFLPRLSAAESNLKITGMQVFLVNATERTKWIFLRLTTNNGLTGLGEASDGFGGKVQRSDAARIASTLGEFFELVRGKSPFDIEAYRQSGRAIAKAGALPVRTAFSAIEQAQWDLVGKALGVPVYELFGGKLRDRIPFYANINRVTTQRTPESFAAYARQAVGDGYGTIKAAPFDGFPKLTDDPAEVSKAADLGIACIEAMRKAIGPAPNLMIDCHSHFDVKLAIDVARRLEPQKLTWYEEPVPPQRTEDTMKIHSAIRQPMAGGEILFGMEGFAPLCRNHAVNVIMPDVKHCGGLLEGRKISAMAELDGLDVAPHNPSGPVATAASIQWCAGLSNFMILEHQWNEVPWRGDLVTPPERFEKGSIAVPKAPGFGIELNDKLVREHAL